MQREKWTREARITLDGSGRHLAVRGHRGILTYGLRELRLRLEGGTLRVEGEDLALEEMDAEDLRVTGRIRCVRLEE